MIYKVRYTPQSLKDIAQLKKSEPNAYQKFVELLIELVNHPRIGTGKIEILKYSGEVTRYSRRITDKHRLIYEIHDKTITVLIIAAKGHYSDK
ncbi:Toxin YoeB [termite gut metagenome]|uniref:Putative mRNA interferase YoeB n=1 Tax=termite gut metagenome TaxID=433724 RepID=A0A5J4RF71_9ZZZZ